MIGCMKVTNKLKHWIVKCMGKVSYANTSLISIVCQKAKWMPWIGRYKGFLYLQCQTQCDKCPFGEIVLETAGHVREFQAVVAKVYCHAMAELYWRRYVAKILPRRYYNAVLAGKHRDSAWWFGGQVGYGSSPCIRRDELGNKHVMTTQENFIMGGLLVRTNF